MSRMNEEKITENNHFINNWKKYLLGGLAAFALITAWGNYYTVQPTERAVVTRAGNFQDVAGPGLHFTTPFVTRLTWYNLQLQQFQTVKLNTYTVDNQEVDAVLVVQYSIPEKEIPYIYTNVGDVQSKLLNMVIDRWKIEAGKVNVSEIANNRGKLVKNVLAIVKSEAARLYHVDVVDVQLNNLDYQDSYRAAQARAATVKTEIEASEGLQKKATIEAETAKIQAAGIANQAIEAARGQAESVRLNAAAEAERIRLTGQANADAQELMAKALTANPTLVDLEKAKRWNGVLPQNIYAGTPIPFLNTK